MRIEDPFVALVPDDKHHNKQSGKEECTDKYGFAKDQVAKGDWGAVGEGKTEAEQPMRKDEEQAGEIEAREGQSVATDEGGLGCVRKAAVSMWW